MTAAGVAESTSSRLAEVVARVEPKLRAISEDLSRWRYGEGKWSKRELLGHLIDSASNNHQRFVRAQQTDRLAFPSYAQNHWVAVQRYHDTAWFALLDLWIAYNRHLVQVMRAIPEGRLTMRCDIVGYGESSLGEIVIDYVDHIEHHMRQILGLMP